MWVLEYRYSSTTNMGSLRLARAKGRNGLRNNSWVYYDLTPTLFGQTNKFLDYSDIAYSDGHFYGSCIIGNPPNSAAGLLLYQGGDLPPLSEWGRNDRLFFDLKWSF